MRWLSLALVSELVTVPACVADPSQIIVLEKDAQGNWRARGLPEQELQEHQQAIDYAEDHLKKAFDSRTDPPPEVPGPLRLPSNSHTPDWAGSSHLILDSLGFKFFGDIYPSSVVPLQSVRGSPRF